MKKMIVLGLLILAQLAFAADPVKRLSTAEARSRIEKSATYREVVAAREAGKDITQDARLMERIGKVLELSLKDVVSFSGAENTKLLKLLVVNPMEIMSEVARLASIAKDPTSSAQEKDMAKKSLELMVKASHTVDALVVNEAQAQVQKQKIASIIEISNKISSLDFGQSSKSFVEKYEKALTEGKSVEEAIKVASNGKFTEKELRECE